MTFQGTLFTEPPREKPYEIREADAVELLESFPRGSVDLIVTDPAYESLERHRAKGTTTRLAHSKASSNDWFKIFPNARFPEFFAAAYRALKRDAHLYVFCDQETMFAIKPMGEAAGFKFWKPIVWSKEAIGMGYHYRSLCEFILFFEKGRRKLNNLGIPDVFSVARIRGGYPTEKPVDANEILIRQSSAPGELVVDPFMGSASAGVAALRNGRRFIGGDLTVWPGALPRLAAAHAGEPDPERTENSACDAASAEKQHARSSQPGRDLAGGFQGLHPDAARERDAPYGSDVTGAAFLHDEVVAPTRDHEHATARDASAPTFDDAVGT